MSAENERLLDNTGWRILEELQGNARLTHKELDRRVNLSAPAAADRIKRMEEAGIITGYRAQVDPERVGLPLTAFVRMKCPAPTTRSSRLWWSSCPRCSSATAPQAQTAT
jgi:Lrp/AsnC family transcriptional regulator, leucine-responsive regulatory protein